MKKQIFKEQNLTDIIASYSQELDKGKKPCIDKYLKSFTGDKDKLTELLKTVEFIHNFSKESKKPSDKYIENLSRKLRNLFKEFGK